MTEIILERLQPTRILAVGTKDAFHRARLNENRNFESASPKTGETPMFFITGSCGRWTKLGCKVGVAVFALGLLVAVAPARATAGFTLISGNLTVLNPSAGSPVNLTLDHTNSDTNMFGFTESTGLTLAQPATVDFTQP